MNPGASDNLAYRFPVSVKAVVSIQEKILLLYNERDEWELPGGKLELGEPPAVCVAREVFEELGITVVVEDLLDSWVYHIAEGVDVLMLNYGCKVTDARPEIVISNEHSAWQLFAFEEIETLNMPTGYKNTLALWKKRRDYLDGELK